MDNTIHTHGQLLVEQNIFQIHMINDILGPPFQFQPYTNSNNQKPHGNLQVSIWISMDSTIHTHGQLLVGTKYLPNTYDKRYFGYPIPLPTLYKE
jgi:hypothetical protein